MQKGEKRQVRSEIVFYGSFSPPNNEAELSKASVMQLLKNNLQERLQTGLPIVSSGE